VADYLGTTIDRTIKNTSDSIIYKTERHADENIIYNLNI